MRVPMIAGNWKMNKTPAEAAALAAAIREQVDKMGDKTGNVMDNVERNVERVVCPPFVSLPTVAETLAGSSVAVGAQNIHWADSGAYTGEVSAPMLRGLATHVIIGHSERRQFFAESDESVNRKLHAALAHGLTPIVCVGESLQQNEAGETAAFVSGQVMAALAGIAAEQLPSIVIAYEPIWAIGTGKAATAQQAQELCGDVVRSTVARLFGDQAAQATRILYGGSTNPKNIAEIMQQPDIDGALIGGASLQAESYAEMAQITSRLYA